MMNMSDDYFSISLIQLDIEFTENLKTDFFVKKFLFMQV